MPTKKTGEVSPGRTPCEKCGRESTRMEGGACLCGSCPAPEKGEVPAGDRGCIKTAEGALLGGF